MIILHCSHSEKSRNFIDAIIGPGDIEFVNGVFMNDRHTIYDWSSGGREAWGGTMSISSFPSIVWDVPAHRVPAYTIKRIEGDVIIPMVEKDASQEVQREPSSKESASNFLDEINLRLSKSGDAGKQVSPISDNT